MDSVGVVWWNLSSLLSGDRWRHGWVSCNKRYIRKHWHWHWGFSERMKVDGQILESDLNMVGWIFAYQYRHKTLCKEELVNIWKGKDEEEVFCLSRDIPDTCWVLSHAWCIIENKCMPFLVIRRLIKLITLESFRRVGYILDF